MTHAAYYLDGSAVSSAQFYSVACHPQRHVVVEACAGAGKTWMLVSRIVRALLDGAEPQDILAITFTRKAAGEMRQRLSEWLRAWSQLSHQQAAAELVLRGMDEREAGLRAGELIGLYDRVLASDRPVQLRTFHGWFSQLVQAAPLELLQGLGIDPNFAFIEDTNDLAPLLMRRLRQRVWGDAALHAAWRALSLRHGRYALGNWLDTVRQRSLEIGLADGAGHLAGSVAPAGEVFEEFASGLPVVSAVRGVAFRETAKALASQLGASDKKLRRAAADRLTDALATENDEQAYALFRQALFTDHGDGTPRKLGEVAGLDGMVTMLERIADALSQQQAHEDHSHMLLLSRALLAEYATLKRERRLVDMNDLELLAHAMLSDPVMSGWVQERLDMRVRHLLIDEFQDTSPLQWQALHAWLASYVGAGSDGPRLFIVGDPKQSIYRFRRAEPRVFLAAQEFVQQGLGGTLAACDHTRRCAPGVVAALNTVFAGVAADTGVPWRAHTTQVGEVTDDTVPALALLPSQSRPPRSKGTDAADDVSDALGLAEWRDSLTTPRVEPEVVFRAKEAAAVAEAIAALVNHVAPERIFVLARKRTSLRLVAQALAARGIAHIEPEDLRLAEIPALQDLIAVLDVLASPCQSLSLARFLKSPLIGASDDDLQALARAAPLHAHWLEALLNGKPSSAALQRAQSLLRGWRAVADVLPPHDLLQRIVDESDAMARLAAAAPPAQASQVPRAVDALLLAALELDSGRFVSLYGFVRALRQRRVEAPATLRAGAVQLLTIHGAKGLEAHTVFVMDSDPEPQQGERTTVLAEWPIDAAAPSRLAFVASESRGPPQWREHLVQEREARAREEANALYVAMTRAEEQLVFSRTDPSKRTAGTTWWQRVQGVGGVDVGVRGADGAVVPRPATVTVPTWPATANRRAADPADAPAAAPNADNTAALGRAVHRVLEWATGGATRDAQPLRELCESAALLFGVADAQSIHRVVSSVLDNPACAPFFDTQVIEWAANEVPVRDAQGQSLRIDRLVKLKAPVPCWWVLDYKLSGKPLDDDALVEQLRSYRNAVQEVSAGLPVRCAFITQDGRLLEVA
jgi:ATP-dependent helicase/nuclease subunit A